MQLRMKKAWKKWAAENYFIKIHASNFLLCSGRSPHCMAQNFKHVVQYCTFLAWFDFFFHSKAYASIQFDKIRTRAWFSQTGSRLRSRKISNRSRTCNIIATCLKFCTNQWADVTLLGTKSQACSGNICDICDLKFYWLIKSCPGLFTSHSLIK